MTTVGTAARIWFYKRGDDYITPFIPSSVALGARSDYIEASSPNASQLSAAFRHVNKHNTPGAVTSNSSPRPANATLSSNRHDQEVAIIAGYIGFGLGSSGTASSGVNTGYDSYSQARGLAGPASLAPAYTSEASIGGTGTPAANEGLLVDTFKVVEKNGEVSYHFYNEDGKEVKTEASSWETGNRYVDGNWYECLVYTGKKSGNIYYTWQLGTGQLVDRKGKVKGKGNR